MLSQMSKTAYILVLLGFSHFSFAAPFSEIRIGDEDGFGYNVDGAFGSLIGAYGGSADIDSNGRLNANDVLPDLNGDGCLATGCSDDFDNRLGESVTSTGATNLATTGVEFTDISLSTSYDSASSAGRVYDANTSTFGAGGTFPAGVSGSRPNQPGFVFDFFVESADIAAGTDIFFNMLFADYDVNPADIDFSFANSPSTTLAVSPQNSGLGEDGLIQGAFALLDFSDVFTASGTGYRGYVEVDFDAPNEPYTAFDYVELSVKPIVVDVAEPSAFILLTLGLTGLFMTRRRTR